jgi:hypothetical protein
VTETPIEPVDRPTLAPPGEPCAGCGTPLARDQRYCLTCGARRAGLSAMLSAEPQRRGSPPAVPVAADPGPAAAAPVRGDAPWRLDAGLVAGVGCLLLALLVGVLIGRSGRSGEQAAAPQVVTIGATATPTPGAAAPVSFTSDWPAGKRGFTIELQTLPKDGTDATAVAAAKQAATAKGATGVGALDSDQHSTLDGGNYVIYSGQYADRKAATAALKDLKADFSDAKVVEISDAAQAADTGGNQPSKAQQAADAKAINDLQNTSGEDYSKKSAKLPKDLVTPGKAPPKDNKPAGGGSETETFP